jgi:16S rRNA (adenine1518-N6/adenine1519-N6)-dimethyltransferase
MTRNLSDGSPDSLLEHTKKILRQHGLRAKKGLGQNFLIDEKVLETILDAAELTSSDTVIEVGPGLGILTTELAKRAGWVIAIELDNQLAETLKKSQPGENIIILNQDVLGAAPGEMLQAGSPKFPEAIKPYKVVANLPYYITSPVIRHFLEATVKPELMIVMVQKEVAEAIAAGSGQRSVLSIGVQFFGKPEIMAYVPAASFYPAPRVDSAIVKIEVCDRPPVNVDDEGRFFKLVRAGFTAARKQAANSLAQGLGLPRDDILNLLEKANIDPKRRAETFSLEEWAELYRIFPEVVKHYDYRKGPGQDKPDAGSPAKEV